MKHIPLASVSAQFYADDRPADRRNKVNYYKNGVTVNSRRSCVFRSTPITVTLFNTPERVQYTGSISYNGLGQFHVNLFELILPRPALGPQRENITCPNFTSAYLASVLATVRPLYSALGYRTTCSGVWNLCDWSLNSSLIRPPLRKRIFSQACDGRNAPGTIPAHPFSHLCEEYVDWGYVQISLYKQLNIKRTSHPEKPTVDGRGAHSTASVWLVFRIDISVACRADNFERIPNRHNSSHKWLKGCAGLFQGISSHRHCLAKNSFS